MYRIHYDTQRGCWLLQFLKFSLFWFTVKREIIGPAGENPVFRDEQFSDIEAVDRYITARGIDKVYRRMANPVEREPMFYAPQLQSR